MTFARSLSNESEPNEDTYEAKELHCHATKLIRTISEESLPREMLEEQELDDLYDEKLAKNVRNNLKKNLDDWKTSTPPPSPEMRIKSDAVDSDHSTLLKILKEEAAEGSNLSSMTPSLTELEAALSDMLEKEDSQEGSKEDNKFNVTNEQALKQLEPQIQMNSDGLKSKEGGGKTDWNLVDRESKEDDKAPTSLKQILEDRKPVTGRKVSFCSWEESIAKLESQNDREFADLDKWATPRADGDHRGTANTGSPTDLPPEKPSRLNRSLDDLMENMDAVPTPPRRKNKSLGSVKKEPEVAQNGSALSEHLPNDRLI